MNKVSKKRQMQIPIEMDIKRQIYELGNGLCELCYKERISDRGHEIIYRSHGGDPTDPFNIIQLCYRCHAGEHGNINGYKPHTKEELLKIVEAIRLRQGFIKESQ
jgi:5-methylcytosine-specific restriction endonuclease McrA